MLFRSIGAYQVRLIELDKARVSGHEGELGLVKDTLFLFDLSLKLAQTLMVQLHELQILSRHAFLFALYVQHLILHRVNQVVNSFANSLKFRSQFVGIHN